MAKSSINIQISSIFAFFHAVREAIVTYTIDNPSRNIFDRNGDKSHEYYLELLTEAITNYMDRTGQKIQTSKKKFIWEAVVNLNENHGLKDLKLLARVLRMMFGWQSIQLSIHRDEGRIDRETGEKIYNFHGHLVFLMLNKQGIYCFKKRDFGIKKMEELQTLTARVLKMERGISKKKTKRVRLDHRQYRYVAPIIEKLNKIISGHEQTAAEDELLIYGLNKKLNHEMDINDNHIMEIAKLEEWKKEIIKDILIAVKAGDLTKGSSLDKYIRSAAEIEDKSIQSISSNKIIDDKSPDDDSYSGNMKI